MTIPWKILVVDDDEGIHSITRMVFRGYEFENRPIELINASSGAQAKEILCDHDDIAVILLDVVMETDHEGLNLVTFIREHLNNNDIRIILRTGHPGFAPEAEVIVQYDINDYLSKAELSASRLITSVVVALRSYRDILTVKPASSSMEKIDLALTNQQFLTQISSRLYEKIQPLVKSTYKLEQFKHKPMVSDIVTTIRQECEQLININQLLVPYSAKPAKKLDLIEHLNAFLQSYLTQAKHEGWIVDYEISDIFPETLNIDHDWLKTLLIVLLETALCSTHKSADSSFLIKLDNSTQGSSNKITIEIHANTNRKIKSTPWLGLLDAKLDQLAAFYNGSIIQSASIVNTKNLSDCALIKFSFILH